MWWEKSFWHVMCPDFRSSISENTGLSVVNYDSVIECQTFNSYRCSGGFNSALSLLFATPKIVIGLPVGNSPLLISSEDSSMSFWKFKGKVSEFANFSLL